MVSKEEAKKAAAAATRDAIRVAPATGGGGDDGGDGAAPRDPNSFFELINAANGPLLRSRAGAASTTKKTRENSSKTACQK